VDESPNQIVVLTAARTLTITGTPVKGTSFRIEVTRAGFLLTLAAAQDPEGDFVDPVGATKYILDFWVHEDGVIRYVV
jgi:hypothetical protein